MKVSKLNALPISLLFVFLMLPSVFCEEMTITTYYPSPFGNYRELAAIRMKIGTTYSGSGTTVADNNLIVEGNVGIGVKNPAASLTLNTSGHISWDDGSGGEGATFYRDSGYVFLQAYDNDWTQFTVAAPPKAFGSDSEATLNLYRNYTGGQREFLELYNQYYTGVGQYGIRLQKRNLGAYRDFVIEQSDGTTVNPLLKITAAGNVGIGTTSPQAKLDVFQSGTINTTTPGTTRYGLHFTPQNATVDTAAGITFGAGDTSSGQTAQAGIYSQFSGLYGTKMYFATTDSYATGAKTRMMINHLGNIGIGTTSPSQTLDVTGRVTIAPSGTTPDNGYNGNLVITKPVASGQYINLIRAGTNGWSIGTNYNTSNFAIGLIMATDSNFTSPQFVMDTSGNVGIGTTAPGTYRLSVVGTAGLSTGTAWTNTSDRRWKDVKSELKGNSLSKVLVLRPVSYTWNDLHDQQFGKNPGLKYGFIAQDVEGILPDMTSKDEKGYYWYNPSGMEAILTAAIQEQQDIIKAQQLEIDGLKARLDKLEGKQAQAGK